MGWPGIPDQEIKDCVMEATGLLQEARAAVEQWRSTMTRVNALLDRFETASTSAAAAWQVPPRIEDK